jgi:PAP2 superfamily
MTISRDALGIHSVSGFLLAVQLALLALTLPLYPALGFTLLWPSVMPLLIVVAGLLLGWMYFVSTKTTAFERRLAETLLVFALLLGLTIIAAPAQYVGAALNRPTIDPLLARADGWLGVHVPSLVAWTRLHPRLNRWLVWAYFTLLWQFALTVPLLTALRDRKALWEYVFHFHVCAVVTLLAFAAFPAACAFTFYGFDSTIPQAGFIAHFEGTRRGSIRVLAFGEMEGLVSMPSFHVAGAMMVTWAFRRHVWVLVPVVAINILLTLATFMTGAHYVIDTIGTAAMFAGSVWLWRAWTSRMAGQAWRSYED